MPEQQIDPGEREKKGAQAKSGPKGSQRSVCFHVKGR